MPIIWTRDGIVDNDPWIIPEPRSDAETGPEPVAAPVSNGKTLLTLEQALALDGGESGFGVILQPAEDVRALASLLDRIAILVLTFPAFSDGRAFSQAMLLKDRLDFGGELRAAGTVLLDQVPLMLRVGFTSFVVEHAPTLERLEQKRLPGIELHYQPSADTTHDPGGYSWRRTAILNG